MTGDILGGRKIEATIVGLNYLVELRWGWSPAELNSICVIFPPSGKKKLHSGAKEFKTCRR